MNREIPRVRMFAGPNGSGKSTLKSLLRPDMLGIYLNPDEIEAKVRNSGRLDVSELGIAITTAEIQSAIENSAFLQSVGQLGAADQFAILGDSLVFTGSDFNSYLASVVVDFLRHKLLGSLKSFTFETVMSSRDKVEFLAKAREKGFRTYLYYIATEDPAINVARVQNRVRLGGHAVPEDKIISRYERSLDLLMDAIRQCNRAYIFDNSHHGQVWLSEITDGKSIQLNVEQIPAWFKRAVWDKRSQSIE